MKSTVAIKLCRKVCASKYGLVVCPMKTGRPNLAIKNHLGVSKSGSSEGLGVLDGEVLGDHDGVREGVILGVLLGVRDGVRDGVNDGVNDGVADALGVLDGV